MQIVGLLGILILSFMFLAIIVDEFFIDSLDKISHKLKLSHEVAGATFMAVGSSAPELFTALIASIRGGIHSDVGAGTIVGSAIFNILVIIGVSAMFKKAVLTWQPVLRDLMFYCASIVLLLFTFWDGRIMLWEALIFAIFYVIYVISVTNWSSWLSYNPDDHPIEEIEKESRKNPISKLGSQILSLIIPSPDKNYLGAFIMSIVLIGVTSYLMVESAVVLATSLDISTAIIGLTVLAAGTSVPDLISSVIVAKKGRGDMAISNAVGSNIFDILFALGIPWAIAILITNEPVQVGTENLLSSVFLLFATVVAVLFVLALRKWQIGKRAGILLVLLYFGYIIYSIFQL